MPTPVSRHLWIDLLRGIAVAGMIWTHSANTFLDASLQGTSVYHTMSFYHGLIAPIFFWVAGLMRGMSAARAGQAKPYGPTIKRLLLIWGVGYLLHVPWGPLLNGDFSAGVQRVLFQSDVLHCLALSCLILVTVEKLLRDLLSRRVAVAVLGVLCVGVTASLAGAATGMQWLDAYLSKQHGSLFPLFPWFGFAAAGFLCGTAWAPSRKLGVLAALMAFGVPLLWGDQNVPLFFLERLGWVLLIAVLVACMPMRPRFWGWLLLAGRESLLVYVAHLVMIHGLPLVRGKPLDHALGPTQAPLIVVALFLALLVASLCLAWANERRKVRSRVVY